MQNDKEQLEEQRTEKAPKIADLIKRLDLAEKRIAKQEREHNKLFEAAEHTAELLKTERDERKAETENLRAKLSAFDSKIVEAGTMLNRLNNQVDNITRRPGTFPPETVGAVLGRTNAGQIYWFVSSITFAEAQEAVKGELEEKPGFEFTFLPIMPKKNK
ncbi:hypothetical protein [Phaeodactylibacter xiamenensis]|uniref:hypothetical protein n=1 Tax=Phaeodactylibacter xiamenensis TaxID=1524460 RepID=UPI0024A8994B|nr:hypothetical protein [Phaeodactylibacter xiamenensis]